MPWVWSMRVGGLWGVLGVFLLCVGVWGVDVRIYSVGVSPPLVGVGDVVEVWVGLEKFVAGTVRVVVSVDAPGFAVLVGSVEKVLVGGREVVSLRLRAVREGVFVVSVRVYVNSTEVERRDLVVEVVGRARLRVALYDLFFRTPVEDAVVVAVPRGYAGVEYPLYGRGGVYEAVLPKAAYDVVVKDRLTGVGVEVASLVLDGDREVALVASPLLVSLAASLLVAWVVLGGLVMFTDRLLKYGKLVALGGVVPLVAGVLALVVLGVALVAPDVSPVQLPKSVPLSALAAVSTALGLYVAFQISALAGAAVKEWLDAKKRREEERVEVERKTVSRILECAEKYGGVLVPEILVAECGFSMGEALERLEELVQRGRAVKYSYRGVDYYDFPAVRSHMSDLHRRVIEALRDNPRGLTLAEFPSLGPIPTLERALGDLVEMGVVVEERGVYRLRAFARVRGEWGGGPG